MAEGDRDAFEVGAWLEDVGRGSSESFDRARRLLSYEEYLREVVREPSVHCRDSALWLRDMFDHYGTRTIDYPWGPERRFRLFDQEFPGGGEPLVGQEQVQNEIYRALEGFVRDGRPTRMILLHGPNGSSKTTIVQCIMRGMEYYSTKNEGCRYRYNWVFPAERSGVGPLGFLDERRASAPARSFAHLDDQDIEVKLCCELKDHPLLLLPRAHRTELLGRAGHSGRLPDLVSRSGICPKCKLIFDALMASYRGDLSRVLSHVQVERYYVSRGYRRAAVTIGPEMHVDAQERQVTMDQSLSSLPRTLARVSLYEMHGDLVDGSGGLVEYSDFLKRPLDATKYLLGTLETGEVPVGHAILRVDAVMVGTTNEVHLAGLRKQAEYLSYLGRLDFVKVPYIMHEPTERRIYENQVAPWLGTHLTPHSLEIAGAWGVLSRLSRPDPERYDEGVRDIVAGLDAFDKLDIYSRGRPPERLKLDDAVKLGEIIPDLRSETDGDIVYEGILGASPREVKLVLDRAALDDREPCLTPMAVLRAVDRIGERAKDYPFLAQEVEEGGFHDNDAFVEGLERLLLERLEMEALEASGLLAEGGYEAIWRRYVDNATSWVKGESVGNTSTGKSEKPDETLMREIEAQLGVEEDPADFRQDIMSRIAAWAIERRDGPVDPCTIFAAHLATLKRRKLEESREELASLIEETLDDDSPGSAGVIGRMVDLHGYCEHCARDVLGFLLARRLRVRDGQDATA